MTAWSDAGQGLDLHSPGSRCEREPDAPGRLRTCDSLATRPALCLRAGIQRPRFGRETALTAPPHVHFTFTYRADGLRATQGDPSGSSTW